MRLKMMSDVIQKPKRYLRHIAVALFFIFFVLSCTIFRHWNGWEKLAQIGTFFTGIGIILTALQLIFQERKDTKEQVELALELSDKLQSYALVLNSEELDKNAYINNVKETVILFYRLELYHEKRLIDLKEVQRLSGSSILKLLSISIKTFLKYRSTYEGIEMNISDGFIFRYRDCLLKIYDLLSKYDKEADLFAKEIKELKMAKPSQDVPIHMVKR